MKILRIGTRGSPLARWQAKTVEATISRSGGPPTEIITIKTTGDRLNKEPLSTVGGKSVFVKEIEESLLEGTIDLAVHSAKDLPGILPDGLYISGALAREDPRDAICVSIDKTICESQDALELIQTLGPQPTIGTGSVRRIAQLSRKLADIRFEQIRGNVGTRLRKLDEGNYDALILAAAGLIRLGFSNRISACLTIDQCMPAPGQGIVAMETRENDVETAELMSVISDPTTLAALRAERALLSGLGGDCHVPIGGIAIPKDSNLTLSATVSSLDGSRMLLERQKGTVSEATELGQLVADSLLRAGASRIINEHPL